MEDILALWVIVILLVATVVGAVLLRKWVVRRREERLEEKVGEAKVQAEIHRRYYKKTDEELLAEARVTEEEQSRARLERERIKGAQNVTPVYSNLGNASAQPAAPAPPAPQSPTSRAGDLITGMAIGSLVNSLFSSSSHAKSNTDDGDSHKSGWSNSSSGDSDWGSSDDGPSSDW